MTWLMLFREISTVYCKGHTKQVNAVGVQNADLKCYSKRYIELPLIAQSFKESITCYILQEIYNTFCAALPED